MRQRFKLLSLTLTLFVVAGYSFFWFEAADKLEKEILNEVENLQSKNYTVRYDQLHVSGYPFQLKVMITNPYIVYADDRLTASVEGDLVCSAHLFSLNKIAFEAQGLTKLKLPEGFWTLEKLEVAQVKGDFDVISRKYGGFEMRDVTSNWGDLKHLKFGHSPIDSKGKESGFCDIEGLNFKELTFFKGMPNDLKKLHVTYSFKPFSLKGDLSEALQKWYDSEGTIDLDSLQVNWGPVLLDANGTVAVDENLQPMVAVATEIQGVDEMVHILSENKVIEKKLVPVVKLALGFLKEKKTQKVKLLPKPKKNLRRKSKKKGQWKVMSKQKLPFSQKSKNC